MSGGQTFLDGLMCLLWMTTYTLVLIGTLRYRYPTISPITQAVVAPFELAVVIKFLKDDILRIDYASMAYLYWAGIEIATIAVIVRRGMIARRWLPAYFSLIATETAAMLYFVSYRGEMLFFSYFVTVVGEGFWLAHLLKKDYPLTSLTLAPQCTKLAADALAIPVYLHAGGISTTVMCVSLPVLNIVTLAVFLYRKKKQPYRRRRPIL